MTTTHFHSLGLRADLISAVEDLGFTEATPIQAQAIPHLLEGRDVLGQAQTGTGKTAAFGLPMLQHLEPDGQVQGLVVAPTRELAKQVAGAIHDLSGTGSFRILPVYGGQAYSRQITRLRRGVDIVVGTPGRMLDLIGRGALDLSAVRFAVLDEADEMLSMGFIEDIEAILTELPEQHQTALFSATMPSAIKRLSNRYLVDPETISINPERPTLDAIEQRGYLVRHNDKLDALALLLEFEEVKSAMVFCQTRLGAGELANELASRGYGAEALHGDMSQETRESVLRRFRSGRTDILVATDVAARGLDIDDVSHVINMEAPQDPESYVHRIGRTGRAGKRGVAITLVSPSQSFRVNRIQSVIRRPLERCQLPSAEQVRARREDRFLNQLAMAYADVVSDLDGDLAERVLMQQLVDAGYDPLDLAAAAVQMARSGQNQRPVPEIRQPATRTPQQARPGRPTRRAQTTPRRHTGPRGREQGMVRMTMNLGKEHNLRAGEVVGAIANTSDIPGRAIGAIRIHERDATVDVSEQHAAHVLAKMKGWKLRGQPANLRISE